MSIHTDTMKRPRSSHSPHRAKRARLTHDELSNQICDDDEEFAASLEQNDSHHVFNLQHDESCKRIKRKYDRLSGASQQLRMEQELEFESGLRTDRMNACDEEFNVRKKRRIVKRRVRDKTQQTDKHIEECSRLSNKEEATWSEIGKFRYLCHLLQSADMSENQRQQYVVVLARFQERHNH